MSDALYFTQIKTMQVSTLLRLIHSFKNETSCTAWKPVIDALKWLDDILINFESYSTFKVKYKLEHC